MIHKLIAVITPLLGAVLTLASVFALLYMTVQAELMDDPLRRTLAILGTLAAGVLLLMGSVYLCTRVAVVVFGRSSATPNPGSPPTPAR